MDAQSNTEEVDVRATTMETGAAGPTVHDAADLMELLDLHDLESALHESDFESLDLEESVRTALAEIADASAADTGAVHRDAEPVVEAAAAGEENEPAGSPDA